MSAQEKLAWAERNGVTPPDYVLAAAAKELENSPAGSCCSQGPKPERSSACCAVARRGCCSSAEDAEPAEEAGPSTNDERPPAGQFVWVHGLQAQHCQGLTTIWVVTGAVVPPPARITAPIDVAPPVWFIPARICRWQSLSSPPDVPPPRSALRPV